MPHSGKVECNEALNRLESMGSSFAVNVQYNPIHHIHNHIWGPVTACHKAYVHLIRLAMAASTLKVVTVIHGEDVKYYHIAY